MKTKALTEKFRVGTRVTDRWWQWWGLGTVTKCLKTRIHVRFMDGDRVYDKAHTQFLRIETKSRPRGRNLQNDDRT